MVIKVDDKHISTKERSTGEVSEIPYGMVVWSTGIGTRPVIMDFMKQIGQVDCPRTMPHLIAFLSILLSFAYRTNFYLFEYRLTGGL